MSLCILHVGMHKTGSSSIQAFLSRCLADQRFYYINLGAANASGKLATAFMADPARYHAHRKLGTTAERLWKRRAEIREALAFELRRAQGRTAILSGEDMALLQDRELAELVSFIREHVADVRAVAYVRRPKSFMESAFQQRVKGRLSHFPVEGLYPGYRRMFEKFEHVLGEENVAYWRFEPSEFPAGCVVQDFCRRLGISADSPEVIRVNEGLSRTATGLLYAYRKFGPGFGSGVEAIRQNRRLVAHLSRLNGPRFRLHPGLVAPLLERRADDIAWMEKRLGCSLEEDLATVSPHDVRSESDLLTFSDESLDWLKVQPGVSAGDPAYVGPEQVASWIHQLRRALAEQEHVPGTQNGPSQPVGFARHEAPTTTRVFPTDVQARYDSPDQLKEMGPREGRFRVCVNGTDIDCLFVGKPNDRLFVMLHGARSPERQPVPVFQRWTWSGLFPGSVLYVSDPTLNLDPDRMQAGWYVGTAHTDYMADVVELVRAVAASIGVPEARIYAYGSSAGGFAAMMLAARLGEATAVAINAQITVLDYLPEMVDDLLRAGFAGTPRTQLSREVLARLDARTAIAAAPRMRCVYVQNVRDVSHYRSHFQAFCNATGAPTSGGVSPDGRMLTVLFDHPSRHGPEPKGLAPRLVALAIELSERNANAGEWKERGLSPDVLACQTTCMEVLHPRDLLRQLRAAHPKCLVDLTDEAAEAFIHEVWRALCKALDALEEGPLTVAGLGRFRVRTGTPRSGDAAPERVVVFSPRPEYFAETAA